MTATAEALALLESFPPNARASAIATKLRQRATTERLQAEASFIANAHEEMAVTCLCESALERVLLGEVE